MEPPILQTLAERVDPAHTALVIIDMQKDFCHDGFATSKAGRPLGAAQGIVPALSGLRRAAREAGALVIHVGFLTLPDHMSDSGPWLAQRRRSTYASDKIAVQGSEGAEFIPELSPEPGELAVLKHRYSSFKGTDLDMILRAREIKTLVVTGVSTTVCVESCVRDAFEYNYYVCVPCDGVASWDKSLHDATLRNVEARFGLVTDTAEIKSAWAGARAASNAAE